MGSVAPTLPDRCLCAATELLFYYSIEKCTRLVRVCRFNTGGSCHLTINGARIITPNIRASNGIIHAIDAVLLPPPD
jgi:hypothetical protein